MTDTPLEAREGMEAPGAIERALADALGVSKDDVIAWIGGCVPVSANKQDAAAVALGLPAAYLFEPPGATLSTSALQIG